MWWLAGVSNLEAREESETVDEEDCGNGLQLVENRESENGGWGCSYDQGRKRGEVNG